MNPIDVERALRLVAATSDPDALRGLMRNARDRAPDVERAALRRLAAVTARHEAGTVEHDCWAMVIAVEELRRRSGRKVHRMNRLRPKIEKDGEVAALAYCALNETDGFAEVLAYGTPELTAEAIVLRHPSRFEATVLEAARERLRGAGVDLARGAPQGGLRREPRRHDRGRAALGNRPVQRRRASTS